MNKKKMFYKIILTTLAIVTVATAALCPHTSYAETFTITLKSGKNLVSTPLQPADTAIAAALQSIDGLYSDVWGYDLADRVDPWKHYKPDLVQYSDLKTIKHGWGYAIFVSQDCELIINGTPASQDFSFTLNKGWNVIGWPYLYAQPIATALSSATGAGLVCGVDYLQVSTLDPVNKEQLDFYNLPDTDTIKFFEPGRSYYIYYLKTESKTITLPLIQDTTAPSTPIVADDGEFTAITTQLHAQWSSSDAETGVIEYHYAIGTSEYGVDIVGWTSAGTDTEMTRINLNLQSGPIYYISVKARNGAGLWSSAGCSDGIRINTAPVITAINASVDGILIQGTAFLSDIIDVTAEATDPDGDMLEYKFSAGGIVLRDWSFDNVFHWDTDTVSAIWLDINDLTVSVRDNKGGEDTKTLGVFMFMRPIAPPDLP